MRGYSQDKDHYLRRLRRIEGQVRGLQRMVTEDAYCIDVLTQVSAVTRALQSVALGLLQDHLAHCVAQAVRGGDAEADAKIIEASEAIARLVRAVLANHAGKAVLAPETGSIRCSCLDLAPGEPS
jgi:DNA-binding FrmR family transcriptional regulator